MGSHPGYLADFDSATGMLHALAASLRWEGIPLLGAMSPSRAPVLNLLAWAVNRLPKSLQEQVYIWSGWAEANDRFHDELSRPLTHAIPDGRNP
jgi:hypothetical protein